MRNPYVPLTPTPTPTPTLTPTLTLTHCASAVGAPDLSDEEGTNSNAQNAPGFGAPPPPEPLLDSVVSKFNQFF